MDGGMGGWMDGQIYSSCFGNYKQYSFYEKLSFA